MISVGLVTSWGPGCGTSEHAKNIVEYCKADDIQITVVEGPLSACFDIFRFHVMHLNESGTTLAGFDPVHINVLKQRGIKTLLTMNASSPENNWNPFTKLFDKVAIFEPHTNDGYEYVPIGAPIHDAEVPSPPRHKWIGTNGFPQERKNLLNLAEACEATGYSLRAFIPDSQHADARAVGAQIMQRNLSASCYYSWVPDAFIVSELSYCALACYPYLEWFQGSSSAAMFGVSARTSLMVSRASQFNYLFGRDDVYFIESPRPTVDDIVAAIRAAEADEFKKSTSALYQEHRMDKQGQRYAEIYRSMMA